MNIDDWIREKSMGAASWKAALGVYGLLVAGLVLSGMAIV